MSENEIAYLIRGAIFKVYNAIGPGIYENAYEAALVYELRKLGLTVELQKHLPFEYEEVFLDVGYRIDLLVEDKVIVEVKSVEHLLPVHHKQLITYLRLSKKKLGILVNFNSDDISKNIFRKVNGL
jgi:GxxExxY protein